MAGTGQFDTDAEELVRGCLGDDETCQRQLIGRYAGYCAAIASRILGDEGRDQVEDAVQEAFFAVFRRLSDWRGQNLSAWIGTIAARRAIDARRRLRRRNREKTGMREDDEAPSAPSAVDASLAELREAISSSRDQLTSRQRQVLDGLVAGCSRSEIAAQLGVSDRTIYYELKEVRRRLADLLG